MCSALEVLQTARSVPPIRYNNLVTRLLPNFSISQLDQAADTVLAIA